MMCQAEYIVPSELYAKLCNLIWQSGGFVCCPIAGVVKMQASADVFYSLNGDCLKLLRGESSDGKSS